MANVGEEWEYMVAIHPSYSFARFLLLSWVKQIKTFGGGGEYMVAIHPAGGWGGTGGGARPLHRKC